MTRSSLALVLVVGTTFAACQSAPDKNAADQRTQELEKRVAELERERQATASPSPEIIPPGEAASVEFPPPAPVHRAPASSRTTASARSHSAPAHSTKPVEPPMVVSNDPLNVPPNHPTAPDRVTTEPPAVTSEPAPRVTVRDEPEERISVPAGTQLSLVLETAVSSATSHPGDKVTARVERASGDDGRVLLPGGTVLRGHVVDARPSGRVSGKARVVVAFNEIVVRGRSQRLDTTEIEAVAGDSHERDGALIGGGAAAGAIIGGIAGGGHGAGKGAIIGGLAGTGAVLATKGKEVELASGSRWTVRVRDSVRL